jgi:signal transduction histidine kinase
MTTEADRIAALETELAILQADRASLAGELEALTYAVSHDLRAPLRSLSGFSQALLELPNANLDPKAQHYLSRIQQAGHKMSELIDALLVLSRIARADMQVRELDFSQLCRDAAETIARNYSHRQVQLNIDANMRAWGDARMLRTAIEQLLDNAWKFTSNVPQANVVIGVRNSGSANITYSISDNGIGFDMTYADKLFRPFQRLHAEPQIPGLGIGLATVRRIVARHHGQIRIESAIGAGTCALLTLPLPSSQGV